MEGNGTYSSGKRCASLEAVVGWDGFMTLDWNVKMHAVKQWEKVAAGKRAVPDMRVVQTVKHSFILPDEENMRYLFFLLVVW